MNREEIVKQAKEIMDEFAKALDADTGEVGIEREQDRREGAVQSSDEEFIERMFKNAPKKRDQYIVMEKKKW